MKDRLAGLLQSIERKTVFAAVFLLALIPVLEVLARKLFHTGIPNSTNYIHHLVLILTFLAGMITTREKDHLALTLKMGFSEKMKNRMDLLVSFFASLFTMAFAWSAFSFALNGFSREQKVGPISTKYIVLIMGFGFTVMAFRFVTRIPKDKHNRLLVSAGLVLGSFLAIKPIINILSNLTGSFPQMFESLIMGYDRCIALLGLPLIITLVITAFLGMPIFIVLGGIAFMLFAQGGQALEVVPNESYTLLIDHSIPAIPLFTIAGFLLSESKAGHRLVNLFRSLFSWFPGGLAVVSILVCAFFTTFTGASGVTILALGGLLFMVLREGNYSKKFSTGLLTASGSIGLLFPPSLPIILYGVIAQISIKDMFIGGILPGILMILVMAIVGVLYARHSKVKKETFQARQVLGSIKSAIWEILLPVIILLFYFGGITTLVESSAVAVIYILIVELLIHRDIRIRDLSRIIQKCIPIIGGVLIILALAKALSFFMVDAQVPLKLTEWVQENIHSKYLFLLLLNIGLLITGCFMDIYSAILVVVPLIIPLGDLFQIHPVHLGIIFLANMELGYLTPPVGLNLFLASYRFKSPVQKIYRNILLFFFIQLVSVLLITYLPFFSTVFLKS